MKEINLYLIRHGETVANKNKILQGQTNDHPLTEEGEQQAENLGRILRHKRWHRRYCSDLPRAATTAKIALNQRYQQEEEAENGETELIHTEHLREVCFGVKEGYPRGTSVSKARQLRAEARGVSKEEIEDFAESSKQVLERQHKFVRQVVEHLLLDAKEGKVHDDGASVFCLSHGHFIKTFLTSVCNLKALESIQNCAISVVKLRYKDDTENDIGMHYECEAVQGMWNLNPEQYEMLDNCK